MQEQDDSTTAASLTEEDAIRTRAATPADARRVAEIVDAAYRPYIDQIGTIPGPMMDDYAVVIREHRAWVAEIGGRVEGVIVLRTTDEGFLVDNVAVHPLQRRRGLGKGLLVLAEAEARRAGYDSIYLYTHERMANNIAQYTKFGYVEYDRRSQGDFSLVFMQKQLA